MIVHDKGQPRNPWKVTYRDLQGRQRQRSFRTKTLAEEFERRQGDERRAVLAGLDIDRGHITYEALCELYLAGYEAESKRWFESMLAHSRKRWGSQLVRLLRSEEIQAWITNLERAPKTREHVLTAMRQVLTQGVEWGYLTKSPARYPAVKGPPRRSTMPDVFPFESWAEVLAAATELRRLHDRALVRFIAGTGLRTEEALALEWGHVDRPGFQVRIEQTYTGTTLKRLGKTDASLRTVTLTEHAVEALELLPTQIRRDTPIFRGAYGNRIDLDGFRKTRWYPALERAGLQKRPPYQLRHTFATLALTAGCSLDWVANQLGHVDLNTTRDHYARYLPATNELQRRLFDQIGRQDEKEETGT